jgi:O-antigen/teichoic acid export membrane protein
LKQLSHLITIFKSNFLSLSFRNFFRLLTVDALVKISGFALLPVYLKLLTQEEFGLYGYLLAMVGYLATLLNGGLYLIQSKLYFKYPEAQRGSVTYTISITLLCILGGITCVLVLFGFDKGFFLMLFKHPFDYSLFRLPLLTGVVVTAYGLMITHYYLASGNIRKLQLFNLLRSLVIHALVIVLLYSQPQINGAYIRVAVSFYAELGITALFAALIYQSIDLKFDWSIAKKALRQTFPITIYIVFSLIIFLSDRFYIERMGSLKDLAVYNLAWALAGIIPFISSSIHSIWLPELLKESEQSLIWSKARSMGLKLLVGFTLISICIMGLVKVLLLLSIINKKYEEVLPILPIVLLGAMLLSIFQLVFNYLLSVSRIHILIYIGLGVAILAVWGTPVFVLQWGVYGAAISMVVLNVGLLVPSLMACSYLYRHSTKQK